MAKSKRPKIGLALGSGGLKGIAAHIGVMKVLLKNKIPIDFIAGSSAGSMVGGVYAATKNIKDLEKRYYELKPQDYLFWFSDLTLTSGLIKGERAVEFIREFVKNMDIKDTKIPFSAVTTNLDTGRTVALKKGDLAEAIRASCAVPVILQPKKMKKRWLIDGGASSPVPVQTVRKMGADFVIAVNMDSKLNPVKKQKSSSGITIPKLSITDQTVSILIHNLAKLESSMADITIAPEVKDFTNFNMKDYLGSEEPVKAGEKAAQKAVKHIKEKIEKWKS